jgi:hypothetical protein
MSQEEEHASVDMRQALSDTSSEAERVQIAMLRRATPAKRLGLMCALSSCSRALACRALARARPELSHRELQIAFVELHYGKELADELRSHFAGT